MSFNRRFPQDPGADVLAAIEGINVVDLVPPGPLTGVGTGVAAIVGEFADCTYAVAVDTTGTVTTKCRPVEADTPSDIARLMGALDPTIGEWGNSGGNGIGEIRNKTYSRLVAAGVNIASGKAIRGFRVLPGNVDDTHPIPVVPMQAALVQPGTQFSGGANILRNAGPIAFTADPAYATGTGATISNGGAAATQTLTDAAAHFVSGAAPVAVGDIAVVGIYGTDADAGTYRVEAVTSDTVLVLEKLDGTNFNGSAAARAYRVHPAAAADTGGNHNFASTTGYTVPARPTSTVTAGAGADGDIPQGTVIPPTVAAPAATATTWDPLSGLSIACHPSAAIHYTNAVQGANVAYSSAFDTLYDAAIGALLTEDDPAADVNIVWAARKSAHNRTAIKTHVVAARAQGLPRVGLISPDLHVQTVANATAGADPGVGANRDESVFYCWPGVQTFIPELDGVSTPLAAGPLPSLTGVIDVSSDGMMASILSMLPPERNPGQEDEAVTNLTAPFIALQKGVSGLQMSDYINLRANGVCAPKLQKNVGMVFQSGITTSLVAGQKTISRRRMDDYITQTLVQGWQIFVKQPVTEEWKDGILTTGISFLEELLSTDNPTLQRIQGYDLNLKLNTTALEAQGIFIVGLNVQTLFEGNDITIFASVGPTVVISNTPPQ